MDVVVRSGDRGKGELDERPRVSSSAGDVLFMGVAGGSGLFEWLRWSLVGLPGPMGVLSRSTSFSPSPESKVPCTGAASPHGAALHALWVKAPLCVKRRRRTCRGGVLQARGVCCAKRVSAPCRRSRVCLGIL
jgi:hypothetical protein